MDRVKNLIARASEKLELPQDAILGVPRIEIIGTGSFSLEPHCGLLEYSGEKVSVASNVGTVSITGENLRIRNMNAERITLTGTICSLQLPVKNYE